MTCWSFSDVGLGSSRGVVVAAETAAVCLGWLVESLACSDCGVDCEQLDAVDDSKEPAGDNTLPLSDVTVPINRATANNAHVRNLSVCELKPNSYIYIRNVLLTYFGQEIGPRRTDFSARPKAGHQRSMAERRLVHFAVPAPQILVVAGLIGKTALAIHLRRFQDV